MENKFADRPVEFSIYKGITGKSGSLQFNLKPFNPSAVKEDMSYKEATDTKKGTVFIAARKAIGPNQYDNENQIKFSMDEGDLGQFLLGTAKLVEENTELVNIFHQYETGGITLNKCLKVMQGREAKDGRPTFMFTLSQSAGEESKSVTVPVSSQEMLVLRNLFTNAIPRILGW